MERIHFFVQGSALNPYEVTFERTDKGQLLAFCSCPAGQNGQYCKHRFRILDGKTEGVVSENVGEVPLVAAWLPGTPLQKAIEAVMVAEEKVRLARKQVSEAKRNVAAAMRGR